MVNELDACVILWTTTIGLSPDKKIYKKEDNPRFTYKGKPVNSKTTKTIIVIATIHPLLYPGNLSAPSQSIQSTLQFRSI